MKKNCSVLQKFSFIFAIWKADEKMQLSKVFKVFLQLLISLSWLDDDCLNDFHCSQVFESDVLLAWQFWKIFFYWVQRKQLQSRRWYCEKLEKFRLTDEVDDLERKSSNKLWRRQTYANFAMIATWSQHFTVSLKFLTSEMWANFSIISTVRCMSI